MTWAALFWCAVSVCAPVAAKTIEARYTPSWGKWRESIHVIGPWIHGLVWPYLAIISGVVLGFDTGLYGHNISSWAAGFLACGAGLGAAALVLRRKPLLTSFLLDPIDTLHEEPRWALYRSAALVWIPEPLIAISLGVGLGFLEWALSFAPWREKPTSRHTAQLLRILFSGAIFAATRNFWLTAGTQIGTLLLGHWLSTEGPNQE